MSKRSLLDYIMLTTMFLQSVLGVFLPPYRDTTWIKDTWLGNDLVTLFVVCPLFLFSILSSKSKAAMLNLGCTSYVIYNYCFYMLGTQLNIMFIGYVLLVVVGSISLILKFSSRGLSVRIDAGFDRSRSYLVPAGVFIFIGLGLGIVWIGSWANYVFFEGKLPTDEPSFRLVASLDLVFIVSSMILSGVFLIRREKLGFLFGSAIGVQGFLYLLVLAVNSVLISVRTSSFSGELPIWMLLLCIQAVGIVVLLRQNSEPVHSNI